MTTNDHKSRAEELVAAQTEARCEHAEGPAAAFACEHCWEERIAEALEEAERAGRREGALEMRERAAGAVPANWFDPALSGEKAFSVPMGHGEVEGFCRRIMRRISTLPLPGDPTPEPAE